MTYISLNYRSCARVKTEVPPVQRTFLAPSVFAQAVGLSAAYVRLLVRQQRLEHFRTGTRILMAVTEIGAHASHHDSREGVAGERARAPSHGA